MGNTPVDNGTPPAQGIAARIRAVEQRWGKTFEEILVDMHDHIFGASPPATGSGTASAPATSAQPPSVPVGTAPAGGVSSDDDEDDDETGSEDDDEGDEGAGDAQSTPAVVVTGKKAKGKKSA